LLWPHRRVPDGAHAHLGVANGDPLFFRKKLQNVMAVTEVLALS